MDVVRANIEKIGGSIEIRSEAGRGTTFTAKIPLTLAIVSALIVAVKGERFAVPQIGVVELVRAGPRTEHRIETIAGAKILRLRDRLLPLVSLARVLGLDEAPAIDDSAYVIVAQAGTCDFGLVVDRVFDTEEIVVKPMSPMLKSLNVYSGNTILGDGSVVMILDLNTLAAAVNTPGAAAADSRPVELGAPVSEEVMSLLLFEASAGAPKAVPMALVTRLEQIQADAVE
jgi:two-component system chemotaxis sensor kinase CheA